MKGALAAKALFEPPTLRALLAGFLRQGAEIATENGFAPSCLIECVAQLVDDAEGQASLKDAAAAGAALAERRFYDGISAGEIPSDFPVSARASQTLDLLRGLTIRAQTRTSRKMLLKDAEEAPDLVLRCSCRGVKCDATQLTLDAGGHRPLLRRWAPLCANIGFVMIARGDQLLLAPGIPRHLVTSWERTTLSDDCAIAQRRLRLYRRRWRRYLAMPQRHGRPVLASFDLAISPDLRSMTGMPHRARR